MITFRLVHEADLPILADWYKDRLIIDWYNSGDELGGLASVDRYANEFGQALVIELDGRAVGLMDVEFAEDGVVHIAYFIGAAEKRGHGWGEQIIEAFKIYAANRDWTTIYAKVCVVNYPSWRSLEEADFVLVDRKPAVYIFKNAPAIKFDEIVWGWGSVFDDKVSSQLKVQLDRESADLKNWYSRLRKSS